MKKVVNGTAPNQKKIPLMNTDNRTSSNPGDSLHTAQTDSCLEMLVVHQLDFIDLFVAETLCREYLSHYAPVTGRINDAGAECCYSNVKHEKYCLSGGMLLHNFYREKTYLIKQWQHFYSLR